MAATVAAFAMRLEGTPRSRHWPTACRLTPKSRPSSVSESSRVSAIGSSRVGVRTGLIVESILAQAFRKLRAPPRDRLFTQKRKESLGLRAHGFEARTQPRLLGHRPPGRRGDRDGAGR